MAHITSIGAGMFSDLSICREIYGGTVPVDADAWKALFATEISAKAAGTAAAGEFTRIANVREFPAIGTPPNVVNVPVYGQKSSSQIQGQSDSPSMEITMNFIADDWAKLATECLGNMVGDGKQYAFRFTLLNSEPTGTGATKFASTTGAATLGSTQNSQYFWIGKIEALVVNPQLTDANTATVTITIQSAVFGAFTTNAS